MSGNTFQLRGDGTLAEIGSDGAVVGIVSPMPGGVGREAEEIAPEPKRQPARSKKPADASSQDIVKLARSRVKQIRAELKNHAKLQKELAQLERLIAAANQKPIATVRDFKRSAG